ncbi:MAG: ATP-dependent helicase HrpB [Bradymonadia bacterium]
MTVPAPLPIDEVLPDLVAAVKRAGVAVLVAPPGAGKSTRVPGALLDAGLAGEGKVLMLQPRRVAARATARRIAESRRSPLGGEVGYAVRFDRKVGPKTRIEIVTEGLLTRRIQSDPFLEDVGVVILDEFHERSLTADLGLALLGEICSAVRDDLKVVVMSATLDPGPVSDFLTEAVGQPCPVIESKGRTFPVEISHVARSSEAPLVDRATQMIRSELDALEQQSDRSVGHILTFLPGVGEIEGVRRRLLDSSLPSGVEVMPLHGRLPAAAQDAALASGPRRKIILATNIAETSITVDGVVLVIDSGVARVPRFDPAAGLSRLELQPISQASADQRAGRAGRTRAGRCVRLWTDIDHRRRAPSDLAEFERADLASTVLEILSWGSTPEAFRWFQAPDPRAIAQGEALLHRLGALDAQGLTALGRTLSALPVHPRLGRAIIAGHAVGRLDEVATVAALASERDIFIEPPPGTVAHSDLDLRLEALADIAPPGQGFSRRACGRWGVSASAADRVVRTRDQLMAIAQRQLGRPGAFVSGQRPLVRALMAGFPDRVALRRGPQSDRFKLAGGSGARLSSRSAVKADDLILAVGLEGGRTAEHQITSAWAVERAWLETERTLITQFDPEREAVVQHMALRHLALTLDEVPAGSEADAAAVSQVLAEAAAADPVRAFRPDDKALNWLARLRCAATWAPSLGLPSLDALHSPMDGPPDPFIVTQCLGRRSFADLQRIDLIQAIRDHIGYGAAQAVERLAPDRMVLPGGATARIEYSTPEAPPIFSARIQHLFGMKETPRVGGGRVAVKLHLLAPNMRPVQITSDLAGFWANTYADVRKDLRGRYPKHPWPEDPANAPPVGPRFRRKRS